MTRRELERRLMLQHEERMSRPPKELFPLEERDIKTIQCRNCGRDFVRPGLGTRKPRAFCSEECRDAKHGKRPNVQEAG